MKAEKKGPLSETFALLKHATKQVQEVERKEDEARRTRLEFLEKLVKDVVPALDAMNSDLALHSLGIEVFRIHPDPDQDGDDLPDAALAILRVEEQPEGGDEEGLDEEAADEPYLDEIQPMRWRLAVMHPDHDHPVSLERAAFHFRFDPEQVTRRLNAFIREIAERAERSNKDPEYARKSPEEKELAAVNEAAKKAQKEQAAQKAAGAA